MTSVLSARDLSIGYRRRPPVLAGIDLDIAQGEVISILGVNGIGKSTLMRTLAGMQPPLSGTVSLEGKDLATLSRQDRAQKIAVLLTERLAIGALSVQRLVELGLYPHVGWTGALTDADRHSAAEALAAVGAEHLARRDINELSDGERQRVMIARALAQRPAVLLLDEPAAFLDVVARVEMMAMLGELARDRGVAVVLSSHDLELSLRTADTIWLIQRDGLLRAGAPDALLSDGSLERAFSSERVAYHPGTRSFELRTDGNKP